MSFQELVGRREERGQKQEQEQEEDPRQALVASIFQINTSISTFKRLINTLGTPKDTPELRLKLHETMRYVTNLTQETSATLRAVCESDHGSEVNRGSQIADAKLAKDFQAVLKEFQSAQRAAAERETSYTPIVPQAVLPSSYTTSELNLTEANNLEERALLLEQRRQEVVSVENERLFNEALIEEREQGIEAIQHQIGEVREIFQDLAVLVREQGVMIDDVEMNVESAHSATLQSNKYLSKAANSQKSNSSLACLLFVIFGVALVIALIVLAV